MGDRAVLSMLLPLFLLASVTAWLLAGSEEARSAIIGWGHAAGKQTDASSMGKTTWQHLQLQDVGPADSSSARRLLQQQGDDSGAGSTGSGGIDASGIPDLASSSQCPVALSYQVTQRNGEAGDRDGLHEAFFASFRLQANTVVRAN